MTVDVNKAVDFAAVHREDLIQERSAIIQGLAAQFTSAPPRAEPNARMSENIFKEVFLPLFMGQPNQRYPDIKAGNWVTFAGGPHARVDVVDTNNKVLFTVPSLMQHQLINPITGKADVDMRYVAEQARLYQNNVPQVAESYLDAELTKRTSIMKSDADVTAVLEEWKKILIHFGIAIPAAAQTSSPSNQPDDSDYDDVAP